jgi:hypothetical protein
MANPNITPGHGLILYFKTGNMSDIRQNIAKANWPVEEDIHANSNKMEFSFRDPDGYYWIITEFHNYEG